MNVTIDWSPGALPILSIYNANGEETEKISLAEYDDKERLHQLLKERGFRKRTEEEIQELMAAKKRQRQRDLEMTQQRKITRVQQKIENLKKKGADSEALAGQQEFLQELLAELEKMRSEHLAQEQQEQQQEEEQKEEGRPEDIVRVIDKKPAGARSVSGSARVNSRGGAEL